MDALEKLKLWTQETDASGQEGLPSSRMYTDAQLRDLLELHDGDARATAYDVLLAKAENTQITLPGGMQMADNSAYWLRLARGLRQPRSGNTPRADDPRRN